MFGRIVDVGRCANNHHPSSPAFQWIPVSCDGREERKLFSNSFSKKDDGSGLQFHFSMNHPASKKVATTKEGKTGNEGFDEDKNESGGRPGQTFRSKH